MQVKLWLEGKKGGSDSGKRMLAQNAEQYQAWLDSKEQLFRDSSITDADFTFGDNGHVKIVWEGKDQETARETGLPFVDFMTAGGKEDSQAEAARLFKEKAW